MSTVLLTGAAGGVGTFLRDLLPEYGHELRLLDVVPIPGVPDAIVADVRDSGALARAVRGVDAIIHLAGIPVEAPFPDILGANIEGTYRVYEAARAEGVGRVVYASSNHAVGFTERPPDGAIVGVDTPLRPDTYYGLSKCFGENLASLYADRHGIATVSVRIGTCSSAPRSVRMLATWLSPHDCARLMHACLTARVAGHTVVYGISANTRAWWDQEPARRLGYEPRDDSEVFAAGLLAEYGELAPDDVDYRYLGGDFTVMEP